MLSTMQSWFWFLVMIIVFDLVSIKTRRIGGMREHHLWMLDLFRYFTVEENGRVLKIASSCKNQHIRWKKKKSDIRKNIKMLKEKVLINKL